MLTRKRPQHYQPIKPLTALLSALEAELASDFSNLDEVMERFRDPAERVRLVEAAEAHVRDGHTLAHRVETTLAELGRA